MGVSHIFQAHIEPTLESLQYVPHQATAHLRANCGSDRVSSGSKALRPLSVSSLQRIGNIRNDHRESLQPMIRRCQLVTGSMLPTSFPDSQCFTPNLSRCKHVMYTAVRSLLGDIPQSNTFASKKDQSGHKRLKKAK